MSDSKSKAVRDPRATDQDLTPEFRAGRRKSSWKDQQAAMMLAGVDKDPNYHYHVINDDPGEGGLQKAIDRGYEFVRGNAQTVGEGKDASSESGSPIKYFAGIDSMGNPMWQYVMRIRQEWYDEDQAAKREKRMRGVGTNRTVNDGTGAFDVNIGNRDAKSSITRGPGDKT